MGVVSDTFDRADSGTLGANWQAVPSGGASMGGAGLGIASDQVTGVSGSSIQGSVWIADAFTADQYSEVTTVTNSVGIGAAGGLGEFIGPAVRMTGNSGYVAIYFYNNNAPILQIFRCDGGNFTQIGGTYTIGSALSAGVALRLTVAGTTLTLTQDGVTRVTVTDATYSSGSAGIVAFDAALADSWSAGGTSGATTFNATLTSTDGNGVKTYSVVSVDNGPDPQNMRVLVPTSPAAGRAHNVLIILPNVAGADTTYGDGMETLRGLNAHNVYNVTLVEPQFEVEPWYANCDGNASYQYETFMQADLVPWVLANLTTGGEQVWLIGFSKSGLGAMDLIFKHPNVFQKVAAWDFPASQDHSTTDHGTSVGNGVNYGTDTNFTTNYQLTQAHISSWIAGHDFTTNNRIWIGGYQAFQSDVTAFDGLLTTLSIEHTTETPTQRAHRWDSGWVPDALAALAPAVTQPPTTTAASSADASWQGSFSSHWQWVAPPETKPGF